MKDTSACRDQKKKKKKIEHRGLCPPVDGKKEQRNEKKGVILEIKIAR